MISHYKLIIVPVDGSDSASRAAAFAADLARATESPIQLLYIYSPSAREVMGMAHLPKDQIESISHESAAMAFTKARMAMDLEGLSVEEKSVWGEPREEIVAAAESSDAIIVMGRRGLGQMQKLVMGSVSDAVLSAAHRPVVVVS
ncbi:MAG: universal stress protein [Sphingobacteriia bacterium]|nr:universal stress protein [Sphingobacteriia bacterium]NCC40534.1 universal stress protein [Gammaproteobacteria bacterium]